MAKKRKSKSKVKWGKIGAPKSTKRKAWLASLRAKRKRKGKKSSSSKSSKRGTSYQETW